MQPAKDARQFVKDPFGRYVAGRTWLAFCEDKTLAGFVLWGNPDESDAQSFLQVLPPPGAAFASRMARLVDVRRLGSPDPAAFAVFAQRVVEHGEHLPQIVSKAAVLHVGAMSGALAFGLQGVAPTPFPMALFAAPEAALAWLGATRGLALARELDELQAWVSGASPLLRDLRALLAGHVCDASLPTAARALGLSTRSLQRRLLEQGASFQDEVNVARIRAAERLLLDGDRTVDQVASAVGFSSSHHFAALFRKLVGTSPSRWRAARRATPR